MAVEANVCTPEQFGEFIIAANATDRVHTQAVNLKSETLPAVNFAVQKTGYYCVDARPMDDNTQFTAIAEFRNAYGELPGAQIAKLPFYGGLTIVYAVVGIFWAFLYVQNRSDILPVQNYITATIIFLVVEMLLTWAYYDFLNRHGFSTGAKALMLVVSILNAARNSLSFFLLLIVCMGYGVVKPTLGKTMIFVRWLAITHFVFGVIYAVGSLTIRPEDAGPLVLLVVLPLAATGTAFYVWTLNSLGATMKDLVDRKQKVKVLMYRKLWWCILGSVLVIFLFFFANVVLVTGQTGDFTPDHWQTRWFVLDGWLNLVYLADVAYICYLWRPTANNRRFAMSDEVSLLSRPPFNLEHVLTFHFSLHKMTRASKLRLLVAILSIWMTKRSTDKATLACPRTETRRSKRRPEEPHRCRHRNHSARRRCPATTRWMVRRSLPWEMTATDSPRMRGTKMSGEV